MNPERHDRYRTETFLLEFPERSGIKTGTKTTPFCPDFMSGMAHSGRNGMNFITLDATKCCGKENFEIHDLEIQLCHMFNRRIK